MSTEDHGIQCHVPLDRGASDLSTQISTVMARILDTAPTALPPLYDVIDPEALVRIFTPQALESQGAHECATALVFAWCEQGVRIQDTGATSSATHPLTLTITTETPSPDEVGGDPAADTIVASHAVAPGEALGPSTVLVVADVIGDELSAVCDRLMECPSSDALTALFSPHRDGTARAAGALSFAVEEYIVTVTSTGQITIVPSRQTRPADSGNSRSGDVPESVVNAAWPFVGDLSGSSRQ